MKTGSNLFAPDKNTPPKGPTSWAKLSYFQKFAIITMVFALPVLAFIPLAYEQYQRIDQYGTKEAQGVLYLRNLWNLSDSLHNYAAVSTNVENGVADKTDLTRAKNNVTDALNALKENTEIEKNLGLSITAQNLFRTLYFWRDSHGNEVDVLFIENGKINIFEIKASTTVSSTMFKSLDYFTKLADPNEVNRYLIYGGDTSQNRSNYAVLPWHTISI